MQVEPCSIDDFNVIKKDIADFWGSDRTLYLHHPMLIHEFGNTAWVIRDQGRVVAYLCGFLSQTEPVAYVHLVGVRAAYRRKGLGIQLYEHFISYVQRLHIRKLKAITRPGNHLSIAFHTRRIGMAMQGIPNEEGIPVVRDYAGPGQDRVVFEKNIDPGNGAA